MYALPLNITGGHTNNIAAIGQLCMSDVLSSQISEICIVNTINIYKISQNQVLKLLLKKSKYVARLETREQKGIIQTAPM